MISVSHIGICVSDLAKAMRFYCDGLGFKETIRYKIGSEAGPIMEIDGNIVLNSVMIRKDSLNIELLDFETPKVQRADGRRSLTLTGITHLSLLVDDVDAVAAKAVECGGILVKHTRTKMDQGDFVYLTDPDGTRVELMRLNSGPVPTGV
jgi:catechol 2,3-dioxygenase-like lactoylglutathione lyase family enzyme